jgi:hypothetical protein
MNVCELIGYLSLLPTPMQTPVRLPKHRTGNSKAHQPRTPDNGHNRHFLHQSLGQVSALGFPGTLSRRGSEVGAPGVTVN